MVLVFSPDAFQGAAELFAAQRFGQLAFAQRAANPPQLKARKCEGQQSELEVSGLEGIHAEFNWWIWMQSLVGLGSTAMRITQNIGKC